jgi:hypothetical protein
MGEAARWHPVLHHRRMTGTMRGGSGALLAASFALTWPFRGHHGHLLYAFGAGLLQLSRLRLVSGRFECETAAACNRPRGR